MNKLALIGKIKELYGRGENVLEFLKNKSEGLNDAESIMISYDFQAGSYTRFAEQNAAYLDRYTDAIKRVFLELSEFSSVMEIGVGEATLMNPLMAKIDRQREVKKFRFDISWSRTRYALLNSERAGNAISLFMADLFAIPLPDNSIDIVYTSHSLEPNGGKEKDALQELYRVANKYVVLLEPDFRNAPERGKERMIRHGYVRDLAKHADELGYEVIVSRLFDVCINPLNPTGLTVIKKRESGKASCYSFVCPITRTSLTRWRAHHTHPPGDHALFHDRA
jgi:ubiquinone/menaquinone biosynthesis C-methylase UbiE